MYLCTHTAMQHAHASGVLCDDTHLQLALLSLQTPHLKTSFTCTTLCHMYLDLAHAHIVLTHCLTQLQDKVAVNVHHLNTPYLPLPSSLQSTPKIAFSNGTSHTSLGSTLPRLQAQVMACMSGAERCQTFATWGTSNSCCRQAGSACYTVRCLLG